MRLCRRIRSTGANARVMLILWPQPNRDRRGGHHASAHAASLSDVGRSSDRMVVCSIPTRKQTQADYNFFSFNETSPDTAPNGEI